MLFLSWLKKNFLETLFPVYCLSCENESGDWICEKCLARIEIVDQQICPVCEREHIPQGKLCPSCKRRRESFLDALTVAVSYQNPVVKQSIHYMKYRFIQNLADPLARIMIKSIQKNDLPLPHFIVPVPLHRRRLRWRGFNQSQILAEKISDSLVPLYEIPVGNFLERQKCNKPQMEIKQYKERISNVKNAFKWISGSPNLCGKSVLLVDDIATTGATLQECARILKENGTRKIMVAVVARQTMKQ